MYDDTTHTRSPAQAHAHTNKNLMIHWEFEKFFSNFTYVRFQSLIDFTIKFVAGKFTLDLFEFLYHFCSLNFLCAPSFKGSYHIEWANCRVNGSSSCCNCSNSIQKRTKIVCVEVRLDWIHTEFSTHKSQKTMRHTKKIKTKTGYNIEGVKKK